MPYGVIYIFNSAQDARLRATTDDRWLRADFLQHLSLCTSRCDPIMTELQRRSEVSCIPRKAVWRGPPMVRRKDARLRCGVRLTKSTIMLLVDCLARPETPSPARSVRKNPAGSRPASHA